MSDPENLDSLFREAVSDIDGGDVTALERLLAAHPKLVRDRLDCPGAWLRDKVGGALVGFFEKPYLLWFVAEGPVRKGKLPTNIAEGRADDNRGGEARGCDQPARTTRLHAAAGVLVLDREGMRGAD